MLTIINVASMWTLIFCKLLGKLGIFLIYTGGGYSQKVTDELHNY
jgi:hypothetical protein